MKIKVLDNQRRSIEVGEGDIIPAGWYLPSGEKINEPYRVVRLTIEPDEGPVRYKLKLEPARFKVEREQTDAANTLGSEAASELNARLQSEGIRNEVLAFYWHVPITIDGSPIVGRMKASGIVFGLGIEPKDVKPEDVENLIKEAKAVQAKLEESRRRKAEVHKIYEAIKAAGDAAGLPAGQMVKRGSWVNHEEFGGLSGADYNEWEEWEWAAWAKAAIARAMSGEDVAAAAADEIARAKPNL